MYLRLTGGSNIEQIYSKDYDLTIGKAITLRQGKDICFFLWCNIKKCYQSLKHT